MSSIYLIQMYGELFTPNPLKALLSASGSVPAGGPGPLNSVLVNSLNIGLYVLT